MPGTEMGRGRRSGLGREVYALRSTWAGGQVSTLTCRIFYCKEELSEWDTELANFVLEEQWGDLYLSLTCPSPQKLNCMNAINGSLCLLLSTGSSQ